MNQTTIRTPDDVLERTYRRAMEWADARGITFEDALCAFMPETRRELRDYYARVYA